MNSTLELVDARPLWYVPLRSKAGCDDEVLGFRSTPVLSFDVPAPVIGIELGVDDDAFEGSVILDVENSVAVIEVVTELFVGRIVRRPIVPVSSQQPTGPPAFQSCDLRFPCLRD